jgi:hypothetical protein
MSNIRKRKMQRLESETAVAAEAGNILALSWRTGHCRI